MGKCQLACVFGEDIFVGFQDMNQNVTKTIKKQSEKKTEWKEKP